MESTTRSTPDTTLWAGLTNAQLVDTLHQAHRAEQHAFWRKLRALAEAHTRQLGTTAGAASTQQWVADMLHVTPAEAGSWLKLVRHLDRELPATAAALDRGDITVAHAKVISRVVDDLPVEVSTPALRADVDKTLAAQATTFDPPTLRKVGHHILDNVDPDLADRVLAQQLQAEDDRATRNQYFRMSTDPTTGGFRLDARLPKHVGEQLRVVLDPLAAPQTGPDGYDTRTVDQRNADAFAELVHRLLADKHAPSHGGNPTQLVVTLTRGGNGRTQALGLDLSAATVQQLMCEADKVLLVRDPDSPGKVSLRRLYQRDVRRLLEHRDQGCAFPGCDRPPAWCHAHHITPWSQGGPTTLDNGVLLCGHHHRLIHQHTWAVRLAQDGYPEFIPPDWIDPHQTPQRNTRLTPAA